MIIVKVLFSGDVLECMLGKWKDPQAGLAILQRAQRLIQSFRSLEHPIIWNYHGPRGICETV